MQSRKINSYPRQRLILSRKPEIPARTCSVANGLRTVCGVELATMVLRPFGDRAVQGVHVSDGQIFQGINYARGKVFAICTRKHVADLLNTGRHILAKVCVRIRGEYALQRLEHFQCSYTILNYTLRNGLRISQPVAMKLELIKRL